MEGGFSRRGFLKKSAFVLGAVAVCDLGGMVSANQVSGLTFFS
jgi:hypothetical protein